LRDPNHPTYSRRTAQGRIGLDAKYVLQDKLVLDATVNPDFSQIESDEPQVTASQRFEVIFPEKRPFFLENSNYFLTPINLMFTRRIANPDFGVRLTGKGRALRHWLSGCGRQVPRPRGSARRPPGEQARLLCHRPR